MRKPATKSSHTPYCMATALLMFSFVVLCGLVLQIDPFVIAKRAVLAAVLIWAVTLVGFRVIALAMMKATR